jgi:ribosomal protein S27E
MSTETGNYLDGNAAAGEMSNVFAFDVTSAEIRCASCGAVARFASAMIFTDAPGMVARCAVCEGVLARLVRSRTRLLLDMRGVSYIAIDRETKQ